jgi:hypothetical protein
MIVDISRSDDMFLARVGSLPLARIDPAWVLLLGVFLADIVHCDLI